MKKYTLRDESGTEFEIKADSIKEAMEEAENYVKNSDYGDITSTIWEDIRITSDDGEEKDITVQIDPEEPECIEGKDHNWKSPYHLLGGLKENPGVWSHGGGVIIREVCINCGCEKITDTWAQRMDTGEQGLTLVEYEEGKYSRLEIEQAEDYIYPSELEWHQLPEDQGQIVEVWYALDENYLYCHTHDRSDGEVNFKRAPLIPDDSVFEPWNSQLPNCGSWKKLLPQKVLK